MTTTEIILKHLDAIYPRFSFNWEIMSRKTPFGFISHKADSRIRELCVGEGDKKHFIVKGKYHDLNFELEGDMSDGKRVYRARIIGPESDIDKMFKSIKPQFSQDYANMVNTYKRYQLARTDNDKKRLAHDFKFYYEKLT